MLSSSIRLYLGICGMTLMLLLLSYSFRKRGWAWREKGELSQWLNVHMAMGALSACLILLHSGFQARGIAAFPFYSLLSVIVSGIAGKFLMVQVACSRQDLALKMWNVQKNIRQSITPTPEFLLYKQEVVVVEVGGAPHIEAPWDRDLRQLFFHSRLGDLYLKLRRPEIWSEIPGAQLESIKQYSLLGQKLSIYDVNQKILSYWLPMHILFTTVLYISAALHIASSLYYLVHW